MNLTQIRRKNLHTVYKLIEDGVDTLEEIIKASGISRKTVCDILTDMRSKHYIKSYSSPENHIGRRTNHYEVTKTFNYCYIELQDEELAIIGISMAGKCICRFQYPMYDRHEKTQELLEESLRRIKNSKDGPSCMGIFFVNLRGDVLDLPKELIVSNHKEILLSSYADPEKVHLIIINDEKYLSLYSHIQKTECTLEEIERIVHVDEIFKFEGKLYLDVFDALERISKLNYEKFILEKG